MHTSFVLFIAPLLWFVVAAALLFVMATVYVRALLVVARLPSLAKVVLSVFLWLTFGAALVAPLFGWIAVAKTYFPAALEFPALLWVMLCFGLCFVAVHRPVKQRLPQLRAAGFFRQ